jgi:thiamine transporter
MPGNDSNLLFTGVYEMTDNKTLGMSDKTFRLVLSAVMVGLAVVLSLIKLFQLPLGGSVTLCSMLPILLIGYKYGPKWGLFTGFVYSIIQLLLDSGLLASFAGMHWQSVIGSVLLDYIIAFSVLGLAGIYGRGFGKFMAGIVTCVVLRFISHVASGVIIFYAYAFDSNNIPSNLLFLKGHVFMYSAAYNGMFLLPELALCLVAAALLYKPLRSFLEKK